MWLLCSILNNHFKKKMINIFCYRPYIEELLNVKYTHFSYIPADKDLDIIPVLKYYKTLQYDCGVQNYRSVLNRFRCALLKFLQRMLTVKSYKQFFITSLLKSSFLTGTLSIFTITFLII